MPAVSVPEIVDEPELSEVRDPFSPPVIAPLPCTVVLPSVVEARVDEPVTAKEVVAVSTPTVAELVSEVEAFKVAMLEVVAKEVEA